MKNKRVCVIGAGIAGLSSAKNLLEAGIKPIILERTESIGGTWVFTDKVGYDEHGLPVHSSMYKSLRTNLPKEVMTLPGLEFDSKKNSFLPAEDIINYIQQYAKKFDIPKYVKFHHYVTHVKPKGNGWIVMYKNLNTRKEFIQEFDAVMVCIGHYSVPSMPNIKGLEIFEGKVLHSHDYKSLEGYSGKRTVVMGAGPSGLDLSVELTKACQKVYFSHHLNQTPDISYLENLEYKPDIKEFDKTTVTFKDGTKEEIDVVLLCTGYYYDYSFLDPICGISVDENHVKGLYKELINIEYPTMCIIGIPFWVVSIPMMDLQVRYFVELIQGNFELPNKEKMLSHSNAHFEELANAGIKKKHFHKLGPRQATYYKSLSEEAKIRCLPPVLGKMQQDAEKLLLSDIQLMRRTNYKVLDDETFETSVIN